MQRKIYCFLDVDDTWMKKNSRCKLKKYLKIHLLNFYTQIIMFFLMIQKKFKKFSKKLSSGFIAQELLNSYDIGILTVLVNREIFKNRKFNNSYNVIGDFDYFINLSLSHKIKALQQPLAVYRLHGDNFSSKKTDVYISELSSWLQINKKKKKNLNLSLSNQ